MNKAAHILPGEMESFAGDFRCLLDRIGSADGIFPLNSLAETDPIRNFDALKNFLRSYRSRILVPIELPAICQAYGHATRYQCKELLVLDGKLAEEPRLKHFAGASQYIGQLHLARLRPLKENRLVQRYLGALDAGEALAWHTLVYGVSLAIYSVPLRQGLLAFSQLTLGGFIYSAAPRLKLSEVNCQDLLAQLTVDLPRLLDGVLQGSEFDLFKAA